ICEVADSRIPKPWFVNTQTGYRYQATCSTHTPANKAALKALAIAEGGTTVVANRACELSEGNVFSGEFWHFCGQKCKRWFALGGEIKRSLLRSFINLIFKNNLGFTP